MIKGPFLSPAACGPHRPGCCTRRTSAPYELGQRASLWVAAGVVAHTLWTSAAPAMTYPLFAEEWHLTHTVTTGIFATYHRSGWLRRCVRLCRPARRNPVGCGLFARLHPAVRGGPRWALAVCGRAFMGIGVGLTAGPSTAAMVEFS